MKAVAFLSQFAKHVLTIRPDYVEVVNGVRRVVRGKRIEFQPIAGGRGRYTTSDPEEIQFLREHPDMRAGILVEVRPGAPPAPSGSRSTAEGGSNDDAPGPAVPEPPASAAPASLGEVNYLKLQAFARSQGIAVPAGTKRAELAAQLEELGFTVADVLRSVDVPEA